MTKAAQVGTSGTRQVRRRRAHGPAAYEAVNERVNLTRKLIDDGAPAIFEASFLADNTFVAVDVLTPKDGGFHLTEVKSSSSQKEEHLPDVAVQIHVLEQSGIHVTGVDIMHLNKECHFPDLTNLFERTDVTEAVQPLLEQSRLGNRRAAPDARRPAARHSDRTAVP